jgi:hypothetical protein
MRVRRISTRSCATLQAESFPRNSNIDLVLNLTPQLPPVSADEAKLKRAF